jgi:hypothetical protein
MAPACVFIKSVWRKGNSPPFGGAEAMVTPLALSSMGRLGAPQEVAALAGRLQALSPLSTLARGFAVPRDGDGRLLRRSADFVPGTPFQLRVVDGTVPARVDPS